MPDPRVDAFRQAWEANPDPVFRNDLKNAFAEGIMQNETQPLGLGILRETSQAIGEDLTILYTKQPFVAPITPEESRDITNRAISENTPWYRRAFSKALAVAEWEQDNIAEPSAAIVLEQLFKLYPGQQNFERNLDLARRDIQRERVKEGKQASLLDHAKAARDAYNATNLSWGLKGFSELIFDPLNLVGAGIPGKLSKAAPAMKPLLFPARVIDEAPAFLVKKAFQGAGQLKKLPFIEALAKPHWTAEVNETRKLVHQGVTDAFGPLIESGNPADTMAILGNLTEFPRDAGPHSLRNILNHLGNAQGLAGHEKFLDDLATKTPKEAADLISEFVALFDARSLKKGGELISGKVIEESLSVRRAKTVERIFVKLGQDEKQAKALGIAIDQNIFGWIENTYLRKIEPNFVRPWAMAHLAFAGYLPLNMVEDIGMSMLGMGVIGRGGAGDVSFNLLKQGLTGKGIPPQHLNGAQGRAKNILQIQTGQFKEVKEVPLQKMANASSFGLLKKAGEWGFAYRQKVWRTKFNQQFEVALKEAGITNEEVTNLRSLVQGEFPEGLEHMRDEIGSTIWEMMATGNADAVRAVKGMVSDVAITQKVQAGLLTEFPNMPPDVRAAFLEQVFKEGGVTADNANRVADTMRENLLDWHKFSSEGIKARMGDFVDALGQRAPKSATEAAGLLRMLQHAGDTISQLPREIRAHTKRVASKLQPGQRDQVWQDSIKVITQDVSKVRQQYEDALARSQPHIERLLGTTTKTAVQEGSVGASITKIFDSYKEISRNLDETWESFRARTADHFASVPKGDRDEIFWMQYEDIGNEVWGAEKLVRDELANTARTGWNSLLDVLPANLSGKDREFMKAGIEASLGDARQRANDLTIQLNDLENATNIPDSLLPEHTRRIGRVKEALVISAQHHKDLDKRLGIFNKRRTSTKPSELKDYDKAIVALNTSIEEAAKNGHPSVGAFQQQLAQTISERDEAFQSLIPAYLRPEWDMLNAQAKHLTELVEIGGRGSATRGKDLAKTNRAINRFRKRIESGEGLEELQRISGATDTILSGTARSVLRSSDGAIPETLEDMSEAIAQLADQGDPSAVSFIEAMESLEVRFGESPLEEAGRASLGTSERELLERVFTRVVETADRPALTPLKLDTLRNASIKDLHPDRALVELVEEGLVTSPIKLKDGKWKVTLTDEGNEALSLTTDQTIDIAEITANLPDAVREFDTVIDQMWTELDGIVQKAVDVAQNPPLKAGDSARIGTYIDNMAGQLERNPVMANKMKVARQTAGEATNASYSDFFINYDNNNTLDFVMQRFMPFWMYESRRFPRLIKLAAKRPILAKHYTMLMGDWDYGYTPTPFGFEFNPSKGMITNQLRRTVSRDFPELHGGFRGATEEFTGWMGRGGFYFNGPISGAIDLAQGEPGSLTPPPLSLLLHGMAAAGVNLPEPLSDLAFNARYLQFQVDSVLGDMGHNATSIRRRADAGEDEAAGIFYAARQQAALKIIATSQSSVLRYRPDSKTEFKFNQKEAVQEIIGLTLEDQERAQDLGLSVYEMVPVSGFQRRELREMIPNYDAWVGASISLRPLEEQKKIRRIDAFWAEHTRQQEAYEASIKDISDRWEEGEISGVEARRELTQEQRTRSTMIESLQSREEFKDVPLTLSERQDYAKQFNKPPQMPHPVDELLEGYYKIDPESVAFKDDITGETDWGAFFDAREAHINSAVPQIQSIARDALARAETPLERMLKASKEYLRAYYGVRADLTEQAEAQEPGVTLAYREYRRLQNLSRITIGDPEVSAAFKKDAIDIAAQFPIVRTIESTTRTFRKDFRANDPTMEAVYQMFISSPGVAPSIGDTSRQDLRGVRERRPIRTDRPPRQLR